LLIIGGGQLSQYLAQMSQALDYHVTVCDPREEYRDGWNLPGVALNHAMPDDLALMEALKSDAFYVGAIGSRVNNDKRRERLKLFDVTDAELARLHGPIGIYIGSKTPSEIAISILAEMTAIKNGVRLPKEVAVAHAKGAADQPATDAQCGLE
jgi:xanthine dehydrogenase accessory factor